MIGYPVRIAGYHGIVFWRQDILQGVVIGVSEFISDEFFKLSNM